MVLLDRLCDALPNILIDIEFLVTCESPSSDRAAVEAGARAVARLGEQRLGVAPELIVVEGYTHVRWRFGTGPRKLLLVGHLDTVWPLGSLATHPFEIKDGILRGPGCFDMKAGLVMTLHALSELTDLDGLTLLVTGDEELGSLTSRKLIESEARSCAAALVLEAPAGRALKTARKGMSIYEIAVEGRAAHAGLEPERGVNAGLQLAHLILALDALSDSASGTTVTPTFARVGTTTNTVPAHASVSVDVRARTIVEQDRVDAAIRALTPAVPGARLVVNGGPNRPPLETSASADLFARARQVAQEMGLAEPISAAVGSGSDGNLTAGVGTPTLDGLGAIGGGAHADDEHVVVGELPASAALLAALVADLLGHPLASPTGPSPADRTA